MSTFDTDEVREEEVDDTTPAQSEPEKGSGRGAPSYPVRRVGADLPEEPPAGRSRLYFDLLSAVKADVDGHGEWYEIAVFATTTGASDAFKAIEAGDRDVPDGKWAFQPRRENDEAGKRISKLYARYLGEAE